MISDIHDSIVRKIFALPEHMAAELRAVLPREMSAELAFETLAILPGSYIDERLRSTRSDLLFSIRTKDGDPLLLYVLFEHKSTPEPGTLDQVHGYKTRIWADYRAQHPPPAELPGILAVVLYHGQRPWPGPVEFRERYPARMASSPLMAYLLNFRCIVDDLTDADDHRLTGREATPLLHLAWLVLKHGRYSPDLHQRLMANVGLWQLVAQMPDGIMALNMLLDYIEQASEHVSPAQLHELADAAHPKLEKTMATVRERLQEQWTQEAYKTILEKMLRHRFGELSPEMKVRLERATGNELELFAERILSAQRIEDVFGTQE